MEQLLHERTGCVTSIGELINEKLPSIKEALAGSTVYRQPSTDNGLMSNVERLTSNEEGMTEPQPNTLGVPDGTDELKIENGKLKIDTRPRLSGTPSNLEGDVREDAHAISTTPPDLPFRRGGGLRGGI